MDSRKFLKNISISFLLIVGMSLFSILLRKPIIEKNIKKVEEMDVVSVKKEVKYVVLNENVETKISDEGQTNNRPYRGIDYYEENNPENVLPHLLRITRMIKENTKIDNKDEKAFDNFPEMKNLISSNKIIKIEEKELKEMIFVLNGFEDNGEMNNFTDLKRLKIADRMLRYENQKRFLLSKAPSNGFYLITENIELPIGLSGNDSVYFVLDNKIKMPKGSLGKSTIFKIEDLTLINKRKKDFPNAKEENFTLKEDVNVFVVSGDSFTLFDKVVSQDSIKDIIRKKDIYINNAEKQNLLFLFASEKMLWQLNFKDKDAQKNLLGVIAVSCKEQAVSGLPKNTFIIKKYFTEVPCNPKLENIELQKIQRSIKELVNNITGKEIKHLLNRKKTSNIISFDSISDNYINTIDYKESDLSIGYNSVKDLISEGKIRKATKKEISDSYWPYKRRDKNPCYKVLKSLTVPYLSHTRLKLCLLVDKEMDVEIKGKESDMHIRELKKR